MFSSENGVTWKVDFFSGIINWGFQPKKYSSKFMIYLRFSYIVIRICLRCPVYEATLHFFAVTNDINQAESEN